MSDDASNDPNPGTGPVGTDAKAEPPGPERANGSAEARPGSRGPDDGSGSGSNGAPTNGASAKDSDPGTPAGGAEHDTGEAPADPSAGESSGEGGSGTDDDRSGLEKRLDIVLSQRTPRCVLMLVNGGTPGRLFLLERQETIIGRSPDAQVRVDEQSVSQHHARIVNTGSSCYIEDLDSTNGTFVNQQPITKAELRHGDSVWVGSSVFAFLKEGEDHGARTVALTQGRGRAVARQATPVPRPMVSTSQVPEAEGASLADLIRKMVRAYRFFRRHLFAICVPPLIGLLLGGATVFLLPPPDQAFCQVKLHPDAKENPIADGWQPQTKSGERFFSTAVQDFNHADLVTKTLEDLGEQNPPGDRVAAISSRLTLVRQGPDNFMATYKGPYFGNKGPDAVTYLRAHMKEFLDTEVEKALKVFRAEATFLKGQLEQADKDLKDIEAKLLKYKEANLEGLPDQASGTHSTRFEMMGRQAELAAELSRHKMELRVARQQLKRADPIVETKVQSTGPYRTRLADINRQLSEARASGLGEKHPKVVQLKSEAKNLQSLIDQTVHSESTDIDRRANPRYQELRSRVSELEVAVKATEQELGSISSNKKELDKVAAKLPEVEAHLEEMTRNQLATKELHGRLFEQVKKAELQLQLERASAAARAEMLIPPTPGRPGRVKVFAIRVGGGFMLGLLIGLMIAAISELRAYLRDNMDELTS